MPTSTRTISGYESSSGVVTFNETENGPVFVSPPPLRVRESDVGRYHIPAQPVNNYRGEPVPIDNSLYGINTTSYQWADGTVSPASYEPPRSDDYLYSRFTAPVSGVYSFYPSGSPSYNIEFSAGDQIYRDRDSGVTINDGRRSTIFILTGQNTLTPDGMELCYQSPQSSAATATNEVVALKAKVEELEKLTQFLIDTLHEKGLLT